VLKGFSDYPEWISRQLLSGQFDVVCLAYRLPAVFIYCDKHYSVHTFHDLRKVLATFQAGLVYHRLSKTITKTLNEPSWFARRFFVSVHQTMHFERGDPVRNCKMRFSIERSGLRPAIRKVQLDELPFGDLIIRQKVFRDLEVT
jgi:hypothetical protein